MTTNQLLYLHRNAVASLGVEMSQIIVAVEAGLRAKGLGQVEMPPKPGIHTRPDAFIHAMPAYVKSQEAAGMKWIAGYPSNQARGLPYISGLFILNDPETGLPLSVMDATWITAMRTGAATAVAAKYLARPDSRVLGVLGCGVQGRSNTEALQKVLPGLECVQAYDVQADAAGQFREECRGRYGLGCTVCESPRQAVSGADVIVTAGPILRSPSPVIVPEWLRGGAFVCPLDFDSYVSPRVFEAAGQFCTDDVRQFRYYQEAGYFSGIAREPVDLGAVVAGGAPRRWSAAELILSVNLGLAVEDVVTARLVYELALKRGAGEWLEL